jgi:thioredoxin reductase (NADPH)
MFVFIGATPNTDWLSVERDEHGYIKTNAQYMTNIPGVFAAGDVVSGALKNVSSALGSSAIALSNIRRYLQNK